MDSKPGDQISHLFYNKDNSSSEKNSLINSIDSDEDEYLYNDNDNELVDDYEDGDVKLSNEEIKINYFKSKIKLTWEKEGREILNKDASIIKLKNKKILKSLLINPIPDSMRKDYWLLVSGAKREKKNNPNYYRNVLAYFTINNIPSPYENQIDLDLPRTFPNDPFFKKQINKTKLKNILIAYSRRNVNIGYNQGFNFIVGRLLKIIQNEEDTFWVFTMLIERILPLDYYNEAAGIMLDCTIIKELLKKHCAKSYNHINKLNYEMTINNILFKWLISLFTENINDDLYLLIWDLLLLEGHITIYKTIIAIFKLITNDIICTDNIENIMNIFNNCLFDESFYKKFNYYLLIKIFNFDNKLFVNNKLLIYPKITNSILRIPMIYKQINKNNENDGIDCNSNWNFCIKNKTDFFVIKDFFIIKNASFPIIDNFYFFNNKCSNKNYKNYYKLNEKSRKLSYDNKSNIKLFTKNNLKLYNNLLIVRQKHICKKGNIVENEKKKKLKRSKSSFCLYSKYYKLINLYNYQNKNTINLTNSLGINISKIFNNIASYIKDNKDNYISYDINIFS